MGEDVLEFEGEIWRSESVAAWAFVSLPADTADEVRLAGGPPTAFGSVRVEVTLGGSTWRTSVFPDARRGTFVLPVKTAVRRAERVDVGDPVRVTLRVVDG